MKNIISFGAGQNSTAMIILMKNTNIPIDEIIFANVGNGCEMPETYTFLKEFKEWCKNNNLKFTELESTHGNLKKYYEERNLIPYRMFRSCTDRFKVRSINKYIKNNYKEKVNMFIGIGIDESKRAKGFKETKKAIYYFPLIENKINRKGCIDIIKKEGLSIPVKSGCYFCPFQSKKSWLELYKNHTNLFEEALKFEKNCKAYPKGNLMGNLTLEELKKSIKEQTNLGEFMKEDIQIQKCIYCHN